jgi:hypothetical protein
MGLGRRARSQCSCRQTKYVWSSFLAGQPLALLVRTRQTRSFQLDTRLLDTNWVERCGPCYHRIPFPRFLVPRTPTLLFREEQLESDCKLVFTSPPLPSPTFLSLLSVRLLKLEIFQIVLLRTSTIARSHKHRGQLDSGVIRSPRRVLGTLQQSGCVVQSLTQVTSCWCGCVRSQSSVARSRRKNRTRWTDRWWRVDWT